MNATMRLKNLSLLVIAVMVAVISILACAGSKQGNPIYSVPPVVGDINIIGDHIYFAHKAGVYAKHDKESLRRIDRLKIHKCYNAVYSEYLDRILIHADYNPSKIAVIDYENFDVESEYEFEGRINDICTSVDKLYFVRDNSWISDAEPGLSIELPGNTGILTEVGLDDMMINWEVRIGTIPTFVVDAGNYVGTMARELVVDDEKNVTGNLVNVVDKNTREVKEFMAGAPLCGYMEYDGCSKIYISNPEGMTEYKTVKIAGISVLDLSTWQMEHIVFEKDIEEYNFWKAQGTCLDGTDLYIAWVNSVKDGKTYFGKYDTVTGELENIELPGISQYLIFCKVDGDNIYFSTGDGWLIKYTME
jgi:hypothetical protein